MRCAEAVERMMTADPIELRPGRDTALGRHLQECARCRAVAGTLRTELQTLSLGLDRLAAEGDRDGAAEQALKAARGADATPDAVSTAGRRGAGARSGPLRWRASSRIAWVPLAAAAGLAAVLLLGRAGDPPVPGPSAGRDAVRPSEPRVAVHPPSERGAVVMETTNPTITIVWLYERENP